MIRRLPFLKVSAGLLEPKHVQAIGPALWEFLMLVHWQTSEDGTVNGGRPVRIDDIAGQLGQNRRTTERNLARLQPYVETRRTPYGLTFKILKPSKFKRYDKSVASGYDKTVISGYDKSVASEGERYDKFGGADTTKVSHPILIDNTEKRTLSRKLNGHFELWWNTLPRRVGKAKARTAYLKIILEGKPGPNRLTDLDEFKTLATFELRHNRLMQTTPVIAADWRKREERYIPHPATFLNSGDWLTAPEPVKADDGFKKSWE